jgi:hypothetical protein
MTHFHHGVKCENSKFRHPKQEDTNRITRKMNPNCRDLKVSYHSKKDALAHAGRLERDLSRVLRPYKCPDCNEWHLTSKENYGGGFSQSMHRGCIITGNEGLYSSPVLPGQDYLSIQDIRHAVNVFIDNLCKESGSVHVR